MSLTARPFLLVLLQGVLCATWASGSATFKRNGTGEGSYRASRDAPGSFGLESGAAFYDSGEFSLYPTQWGAAGEPGSELVRLLEGEYDPDEDEQPFTDHREGTDDGDEGLRLFGEEFNDQIDQSELFGDPFAQGQREPVDAEPEAPSGGEAYDRRTSAHVPSSPQQSEDDLVVMAATPTLTRVSEFVRGMLQRFGGVPRQTGAALSAGVQRLLPHRFRPHFVNTSKGLRNIPHQLNDGQLQPAPEDASPTGGVSQPGGAVGAPGGGGGGGRQPGSTGTLGTLFGSFKRKLKAIYPGTVWCGDGNQAKSEDDIGFFRLTDSCCRAHDLCPITIAAGERFNRLKNNGHFTRSHCDCDKKFYNCLKNANTLVSRQIGYTYFNLLKPQCFRHEHPKVDCTKRSRGKCLTYVVDDQQPKQWQWFDNLIF